MILHVRSSKVTAEWEIPAFYLQLIYPWGITLSIQRSAESDTDSRKLSDQPSSQVLWRQEIFKECQKAGPIWDGCPTLLFKTLDSPGSPAKSSKLSSVCCLWSSVRDLLSLGLFVTRFFSALWSWAMITSWLQRSTCALLEPAPWHLFWWGGLQKPVWDRPKYCIYVLPFISSVRCNLNLIYCIHFKLDSMV